MTSQENRNAVRLMSARDPQKAYRQLAELSRRGGIVRGMVIAELDDGHVHIIGQRARPKDMAYLLLAAAQGIEHVAEIDPESDLNAPPSASPTVEPEVRAALDPSVMRSRPDTLASQWDSLCTVMFDPGTSEMQRTEMRRAFYAGAKALFSMLMTLMDPGDEETPADLARLDGWNEELLAFAADLAAGRA